MAEIVLDNVTRRFGEVTALDNLSFSVEPGEIFALVGPDGAGKTTCLRLLCGLVEPDQGNIQVLGKDVAADPEAIKSEIGYMSQRFGLYDDLTVAENIAFYAELYEVPRAEYRERRERLLAFSGLAPFMDRLFRNLSGGMKQKVGLSCALIHTPRVLFLDEPTNGVDPVSRRDFWRILYQLLRENVTIFISTAYLDEAERCSRVGLIHNGRLLACGTPDEVKKLMRGAIIEVRAARPRKTAGLLRHALKEDSVGLFGDRVHVTTQRPEAAAERVRAVLAAAGVQLIGMRLVEPELEDVFVSVLGAQGAGRMTNDQPANVQ
jgi:ABC-2 type transport system ATP-binding protein